MGTERASRRPPGLLKPTAELRKALDEAEICMKFFKDNKLIDWLQSINELYLLEAGIIDDPKILIGSDLDDNTELGGVELLEMKSARGGIYTNLRWQEEINGQDSKRVISMTLGYYSNSNVFYLTLYAGANNTIKSEGVVTGVSTQRDFYLNPELELPKHVDDLLLTFTEELFEFQIL